MAAEQLQVHSVTAHGTKAYGYQEQRKDPADVIQDNSLIH